MKTIMATIAAGLFFACPVLRSQELKLDEVLAKYYQAVGTAGERGWNTLVFEGRNIGRSAEYPYKVYLKRPGMIRTEFGIQGVKMIQVWDGKAGWSIAPWAGSLDPQDMTPDESKGLKDQADIEGPLYQWKEKGYTVRLIGREDLEGTPSYNIELSRPGGDKENYYLDTASFMILKIAYHVMVMGHQQDHDKYLSDYRKVEGVLIPFATTEMYPGPNQQGGDQVAFDQVLVNQELNDSLFMKPVKK